MAVSATYRVDAYRDGKFWLVRVPEIDRSTQARHLREVDGMARDLIAIMQDVQPDSFALDIVVKMSDEALTHIEESMRLRGEASAAQAAAAVEFRAAVREMVNVMGMTVRDVGALLGISFQRVHQLLHDEVADSNPRTPDPTIDGGRDWRPDLVVKAGDRVLVMEAKSGRRAANHEGEWVLWQRDADESLHPDLRGPVNSS